MINRHLKNCKSCIISNEDQKDNLVIDPTYVVGVI